MDVIAGSYGYVRDCEITNFKYGVVFDQAEISDVEFNVISCNEANVWLANGSEHCAPASRSNTHAYVAGQFMTTGGNSFIAAVGGTSAGSAPSFDTTFGHTTVDGSVTWSCLGPNASGQFTNRIGVRANSLLGAVYGIIDDGGVAHSIRDNNIEAASAWAMWLAGVEGGLDIQKQLHREHP